MDQWLRVLLLLLQRTQVWLPAPMSCGSTSCNSSSRASDALCGTPHTPTHVATLIHTYTDTQKKVLGNKFLVE